METCTLEQYRQYLDTFAVPSPADRQLIADGTVGLVLLPEKHFHYQRTVGYSFELAVMAESGTERRLLFVRIDSWDPRYREAAAPGEIDFCIPMAYPGASDRERLTWTLPFGGAWSDTKQEAIVVFDSTWREWLASLPTGLAFSHHGADSAAFLQFGPQERGAIEAFCQG